MTEQENYHLFEEKLEYSSEFLQPTPLEILSKNSLKINFNCMSLAINGGSRVILELASRLHARGHKVSINAIGKDGDTKWFGDLGGVDVHFKFPSKIKRLLHQKMLKRSFRDVQTELLIEMISDCDCDINLATYCLTAAPTFKSGKGDMFYLVQNYEPLFFNDPVFVAKAEKSYTLPLTRLCVSRWLQKKVGGIYIGNGVNTQVFHPYNKFDEKEPNSILYLYRNISWKGDSLAIQTLRQLFNLNPNVKIHIVARTNLPEIGFPYEIHENIPDEELAKLYSKVRVLLFTSEFEGFGLPPLEALACGTNVVSTNFIGNEYLVDGKNCFLGKDVNQLVFQLQKLLENDAIALEHIKNGRITVNKHDFNLMVDRTLRSFYRKALT